MRGVPAVEAVVMIGKHHQVLRAGPAVDTRELAGIETFPVPPMTQFFVADFGRVSEMFQMMLVLLAALYVHVAGIPVAVFSDGLRSPLRGDAEFGVAKPIGRTV